MWPFGDFVPLSYDIVLADPPVPFETFSEKGQSKSQNQHYETMSWEEIGALPVGELGRGDCLLFMWACWPSIKQSLAIMHNWGFRYVTGGSWHKLSKHGKSGFGTGYVMRSATEPFLIGTLGGPKTARNIRNVICSADLTEKRREHSRKPDDQYDICETIMPTALKHIELFARQTRSGWDAWGNETDKFGEAA